MNSKDNSLLIDNKDISEIENNLLIELNNFRIRPKSILNSLNMLINNFKLEQNNNIKEKFDSEPTYLLSREGEYTVRSTEGPYALKECIDVIQNIEGSLQPINLNKNLTKAAKLHLNDISINGTISHEGSDGSNVVQRIEKFCEWEDVCCENIDFGTKKAINILTNFLIDDGVKSRGHRNNLLNNSIKNIGIAFGTHKKYMFCCVLVFAGNIRIKDKPYHNLSDLKYKYPASVYNSCIKKDDDNKNLKIDGKIKNKYQLDDNDAPDDTVEVKYIKETKLFNNKVYRVIKKYFTLSDGSIKIIEVEDF